MLLASAVGVALGSSSRAVADEMWWFSRGGQSGEVLELAHETFAQ